MKHPLPCINNISIANLTNMSNFTKVVFVKPFLTGALALAVAFLAETQSVAAQTTVAAAGMPAVAEAKNAASGIVEIWSATEGATLSDTLQSWAQRAKWKVIWESDSDFRLAANGEFEGSFEDAAQHLITAFGRTRPRLRATFYGGNSVLRIWAERAEP